MTQHYMCQVPDLTWVSPTLPVLISLSLRMPQSMSVPPPPHCVHSPCLWAAPGTALMMTQNGLIKIWAVSGATCTEQSLHAWEYVPGTIHSHMSHVNSVRHMAQPSIKA